jgi:hypothetical protein
MKNLQIMIRVIERVGLLSAPVEVLDYVSLARKCQSVARFVLH